MSQRECRAKAETKGRWGKVESWAKSFKMIKAVKHTVIQHLHWTKSLPQPSAVII